MKKLLPSLLLFCLIILSFSACKKAAVYENITKNLKVNESYEYNLGGFGDEEGAGISKQAQHFLTSEMDYTQINSSVINYKYKPALNFEGVDEVRLKSSRGSDGSGPNKNIIYTNIKFVIANS